MTWERGGGMSAPPSGGGGPSSHLDGYSKGRVAYNARITTTGGADILLEPNPNRISAIIENRSTANNLGVALGVDVTYTGAQGVALLPGERLFLEEVGHEERCEWTGVVRGVMVTGEYVGIIEISRAA